MRRSTSIRLTLALLPALALALAGYAGTGAEQSHGQARFLGAFTWTSPAGQKSDWFGGFSGIEMQDDGRNIIVLSDRATLAHASITRTGDRIKVAHVTKWQKLRASTGTILKGRIVDSEGLVLAPDGSLYISFEGVSRVSHHNNGDSRAKVLPRPAEFRRLPFNKSLEALAMDAAGRLYTLPENAPDLNGNIPVWRWDGLHWTQPFSLPRRKGFMPVGADFGPDGRFYLLERKFLLVGFRSRLRRWEITGEGPKNETTLFETSLGAHDNLEGISVWRDKSGALRATMISDDNFNALQRTEIVEYSLPD